MGVVVNLFLRVLLEYLLVAVIEPSIYSRVDRHGQRLLLLFLFVKYLTNDRQASPIHRPQVGSILFVNAASFSRLVGKAGLARIFGHHLGAERDKSVLLQPVLTRDLPDRVSYR